MNYTNVYEPSEDSFLLTKHSLEQIKENNLKICEVGVGSGYNIVNIAKKFKENNQYFGSDINKDAINLTKQQFKELNIYINLKQTSLLDDFKEKFDVIIFNTPYLPLEDTDNSLDELEIKDRAIYGGRKGYEVIEEFIYQINDKLKITGFVLMIYSSFSHHEYICDILKKNYFDFEILEEESHFFEKLYCLKITKSDILKQLSKLTNIKYLTSGKHSNILEAKDEQREVIIKIGKEQHIQKEIIYLKKLQDESFVPKMYKAKKNFVIIEKIKGSLIKEFLENSNRKNIIVALNKILEICFRLDELNIQKFELTNPYKHIFIEKELNVKFIDFERSIINLNAKNTTQILEYIRRQSNLLENKGLKINENKILEISKKYKEKRFEINLLDICN